MNNNHKLGFFNKISINTKIIFVIILLCLIVYFPSIYGEYTVFDDIECITRNKFISQSFTVKSFINIFTSFVDNQYTPLSLMSFWLEYNALLDYNSYFSHFINIVLHIIGAILLYYLSLELYNNNNKLAFFLSVLWAIHPLQVASVSWLTGRRTILYGLFFIVSLFYYSKYITLSKKRYMCFALLAMILSGLSKTLAFSIPVIWLGIDWLKNRNFGLNIIKEKVFAFIISLLLLLLLFYSANKGINKDKNDNIDIHVKESVFSISYYVFQCVYPHNLSALNELNQNTQKKLTYTYPLFLLFIVLFSIVSLKSKIALFGFLFYLIHIIPLSGLIRVGYNFFVSYHYNYVPIIGVLLVIIEAIRLTKTYLTSRVYQKTIQIFAIFILLVFSFKTFIFAKVYKTSEILLKNALEIDKYNFFAYSNLISFYLNKPDLEKAKLYLKDMSILYPNHYLTYDFKAMILQNNPKEIDKAILLFKKAKELDNEHTFFNNYAYQLGYCYTRLKDWENGEKYFNEYNDLFPNDINTLFYRSLVRQKLGKYILAKEDLKKLNELNKINLNYKLFYFINSLQMLDYCQSIIIMFDFYDFIKRQNNYSQEYFKTIFVIFYRLEKKYYIPYYYYLNEVYSNMMVKNK